MQMELPDGAVSFLREFPSFVSTLTCQNCLQNRYCCANLFVKDSDSKSYVRESAFEIPHKPLQVKTASGSEMLQLFQDVLKLFVQHTVTYTV